MDENQISELENTSEKIVEKNILDLIQKSQTKFKTDVFGIGSMVYRKDPKLWKQVKDNWDEIFTTMEVEVHTNIEIINTSKIKNKGE